MEKTLDREICLRVPGNAYFLFLHKKNKIDQFFT